MILDDNASTDAGAVIVIGRQGACAERSYTFTVFKHSDCQVFVDADAECLSALSVVGISAAGRGGHWRLVREDVETGSIEI